MTSLGSLKSIKAVIFDFDGVFTTNSVFVDKYGHEIVECSRYDGYGIKMLSELNIPSIIISSEKVPIVNARADKLGIDAFAPINNKVNCAKNWVDSLNITLSQTAFLGNDINDLPLLRKVGFPFCPCDAHKTVFHFSHRLLSMGGKGVVRELCDLIKDSYT